MSVMEEAFANNPVPNKTTILHLAQQTGLLERKIYRWFDNKRFRKRHKGAVVLREYTS